MRPQSNGRHPTRADPLGSLACSADATTGHMVHGTPQDGDPRLDRGPDRIRHDRRRGGLLLLGRLQAARLRLGREAFELLEDEFPAQSGDPATIAFKASNGVRSPACERRWKASSPGRKSLPHVSEVASPYESGGAAAISDDGTIAYATVQYDVFTNEIKKENQEADRRR